MIERLRFLILVCLLLIVADSTVHASTKLLFGRDGGVSTSGPSFAQPTRGLPAGARFLDKAIAKIVFDGVKEGAETRALEKYILDVASETYISSTHCVLFSSTMPGSGRQGRAGAGLTWVPYVNAAVAVYAVPASVQEAFETMVTGGHPSRGLILAPAGKIGSIVKEIVPGSEFSAIDIAVGDVIVAIDGRKVTGPKQVVSELSLLDSGARMKVEVLRGHEIHALELDLPEIGSASGDLVAAIGSYNQTSRKITTATAHNANSRSSTSSASNREDDDKGGSWFGSALSAVVESGYVGDVFEELGADGLISEETAAIGSEVASTAQEYVAAVKGSTNPASSDPTEPQKTSIGKALEILGSDRAADGSADGLGFLKTDLVTTSGDAQEGDDLARLDEMASLTDELEQALDDPRRMQELMSKMVSQLGLHKNAFLVAGYPGLLDGTDLHPEDVQARSLVEHANLPYLIYIKCASGEYSGSHESDCNRVYAQHKQLAERAILWVKEYYKDNGGGFER